MKCLLLRSSNQNNAKQIYEIILPVESFIRKLINYDNIQNKRDNKETSFH